MNLVEWLPLSIPWRTATPEQEAEVVRLLDALDAGALTVPAPLPDVAREHLASLETCSDGLASVLDKPSVEEPVFYLPGFLRPLGILLSCAPLVGPTKSPSPRDLARKVLEVGVLLGGGARLGIMNMVSGEEAVPKHYGEVYPRALARLASLSRWAVATIEQRAQDSDDFVPEHVVESMPLLAAARFERSLAVSWPSITPRWELTSGLRDDVRGDETAWQQVDARLRRLTETVAAAEAAEPRNQTQDEPAERAEPGTLVYVPAKGVSVVLEHVDDFDVVAHWSRPARPDTWYPARRLAPVLIDAPPFHGAVPFERAHANKRALNDRMFAIRMKRITVSGTFAQMVTGALDGPSGLESYTGRAYVNEDQARTQDPFGSGEHALQDSWRQWLVGCDPVLGRAAIDWAIRCAALAIVEGTKPFELRKAHLVRACCAWTIDADEDAHAEALAQAVLDHEAPVDQTMLIGLAAFGQHRALELVLASETWTKQAETWREEANDWSDLKTSNWAERGLGILRIVGRLVTEGHDDEVAAAIRKELARSRSSHVLDIDDVLWLRVLHGGRDWTPRQIVLASYFELPEVQSTRPIARLPPDELAAEVEALKRSATTR